MFYSRFSLGIYFAHSINSVYMSLGECGRVVVQEGEDTYIHITNLLPIETNITL